MSDVKSAQDKAFWRKYGDIIIIDTEFQYSREIIQFSACRLVGPEWKVVDNMSIYVKPFSGIKNGIQPIVTQLTGITTEMVEKEGVEPEVAAQMIANFVSKGTVFASYAGLEDLYLLQNLFFKTGLQCPKVFSEHKLKNDRESCKFIDVSLMSRFLMPKILKTINQDGVEKPILETSILSLEKMCRLVNIEVDNTQLHRAYYDVELITKLFIKLFDMIYPEYGEIPVIKWERNHKVLRLYPTWALSKSNNDIQIIKNLRYGNALVGSTKKKSKRKKFRDARRSMKKSMKSIQKNVVFLDVDGVLNNDFTTELYDGFCGVENDKIALLQEIVMKTNAEIVLVSTWKEGWEKEEKENQDSMANYLDKKLANYELTISDKTKDDYYHRGQGVLDYIKTNNTIHYVILDDEIFEDYNINEIKGHLVKISPRYGLVENDVKKSLEIMMI